ncbi:MAG: MATE family efflux transporter [Oscillospiraceae bacterium]|nr:MATE family efflux transporter [Oscillospiraceae bacterium]
MLRKLIGDRAFYRRVMAVAIPIIIQNGISNFVSLLDNIMVGRVGQLPMSGVAIVNQLMFVFNLCVFGAVSGAGIFTAQFHGKQDHEGIRQTFRFKFFIGLLVSGLGIGLFSLAGEPLIKLYMQSDDDPAAIARTLEYGLSYLAVMLFGLIPFALTNTYSSTLRECGQTTVPMVAGISAVIVNLVLNYVLIFGLFGFSAMGVRGAAIATVISRYVELAIVAGWTHMNSRRHPFIKGAYRSPYISGALLKRIIIRGLPLLANEFLWAAGMAVMNQCYSTRGLDVVAAMNIASTLSNVTSVVFLSMGNVVGIIMGQMLGAGRPEAEVRDTDRKLIALSVFSCFVFGSLAAAFSGLFPQIYDATDVARSMAAALILVNAVAMPFNAYNHACYFTLRSGGKTGITFLFDSGFVWACSVPLAFCLSRFTAISILPMYILCLSIDLVKCVLGTYMVKKGTWIQNLAQK